MYDQLAFKEKPYSLHSSYAAQIHGNNTQTYRVSTLQHCKIAHEPKTMCKWGPWWKVTDSPRRRRFLASKALSSTCLSYTDIYCQQISQEPKRMQTWRGYRPMTFWWTTGRSCMRCQHNQLASFSVSCWKHAQTAKYLCSLASYYQLLTDGSAAIFRRVSLKQLPVTLSCLHIVCINCITLRCMQFDIVILALMIQVDKFSNKSNALFAYVLQRIGKTNLIMYGSHIQHQMHYHINRTTVELPWLHGQQLLQRTHPCPRFSFECCPPQQWPSSPCLEPSHLSQPRTPHSYITSHKWWVRMFQSASNSKEVEAEDVKTRTERYKWRCSPHRDSFSTSRALNPFDFIVAPRKRRLLPAPTAHKSSPATSEQNSLASVESFWKGAWTGRGPFLVQSRTFWS